MEKLTPLDRFMRKVELGPEPPCRPGLGPCWLWCAYITPSGYGQFGVGGRSGRNVQAHRFAYEELVGPVPDGLDLDHLCRVRRCVNPRHLEPVTRSVNLTRGDGPALTVARHAAKTECIRGHAYTDVNTYRASDGKRACRECRREAVRRYRAKSRAA